MRIAQESAPEGKIGTKMLRQQGAENVCLTIKVSTLCQRTQFDAG